MPALRLAAPLALLLTLAACAGDSVDFKTPPTPTGLALRDAGLDPTEQAPRSDNPSRLEAPTAWAEVRDGTAVRVHVAILAEEDAGDDFDPLAATYTPFPLEPISDPDPAGFVRWEADLPSRSTDEVLVHWFEVEDDAGDRRQWPEAGAAEAVVVAPIPFTLDFAWPDWPAPFDPVPCLPDVDRIYDDGPNESTLVPAPAFKPIKTPIWVPPSQASVLGNVLGLQSGIGLEVAGEYYFLPLVVMLWNEVANHALGGDQLATSYCPLTDTALAFDTGFDPEDLPRNPHFAPAGLYNSNLSVGRQGMAPGAATAFNQMMGFGFTGPETGVCLDVRPSVLTSFQFWQKLHPETLVLNGDPDLLDDFDYVSRPNPYEDYWRNREIDFPVAFREPQETERLAPKDRVLGVMGGGDPLAIPLGSDSFVHHDEVSGTPVVVFYQSRTAFCLESRLPDTGEELRFQRAAGSWRGVPLYADDRAEPSLWTPEGVAISGPLRGQRLAWVPSMSAFWFAWYAMYPETRFVGAPGS